MPAVGDVLICFQTFSVPMGACVFPITTVHCTTCVVRATAMWRILLVFARVPWITAPIRNRWQLPMVTKQDDIQPTEHFLFACGMPHHFFNVAQARFANHWHFIQNHILHLWRIFPEHFVQMLLFAGIDDGSVLAVLCTDRCFQKAVVRLPIDVVSSDTCWGIDSKEFQNYYRDLAKRVKNKEVDLLIVVGMFLTVI